MPLAPRTDRRSLRRQETIDEILSIAVSIMTEEGVNALNLTAIAGRLGVKPPSIYKYFPSRMAIYDELFLRGQREHLDVMRAAMAENNAGLDALNASLEASGKWALAHRAIAELLFWRPVPKFMPSDEAMSFSHEMVAIQRSAITDAVASGQLGPTAEADKAIDMVSTFIIGVLSQAFANEPELPWGEGRFTSQFSTIMSLLVAAFPPAR
jgi:AcrR family transcriptional regulator